MVDHDDTRRNNHHLFLCTVANSVIHFIKLLLLCSLIYKQLACRRVHRQSFIEAGLLPDGNLQHLISDAATMQIIRWNKGGFGMAAHNYDGDMLTDEVAQVSASELD